MSETIYKPSGIKVQVLSKHDEGEYLMVRSNTSGKVFFAHRDQIEDAQDKSSKSSEPSLRNRRSKRKVAVVRPQIPTDNRINLNTLTPEGLTQVLPGVGIKTAKEIVDLRQSLPGEKFTKLDQLKSIKRVDWDQVFESGDVYVE
jgi:DNA uptake protein ComE-like DNA-binding protein